MGRSHSSILVWEPRSTREIGNYNFLMCLDAGSTQYCRYTKSPLVINPLKEILGTPRVNENLTSVRFEPMTSGLDLPMLYRLSYEASTGAGRGKCSNDIDI